MLGYFDNQRATEQSFNAEGWFMSGDLGSLDDDACLRISGRIKDLIIRGGHNIHPSDIEALALRHPAVNKAAAVPVQDERLGEKACIAVILNAGHTLTPEDLLLHLNESGLSKFDMPEYFLELSSLPLTASGKILKRALVTEIRNGVHNPIPCRWQG